MHLVKMLFSKRHIFSSFLSMANTPKEIVLKGIPASPGICHGNATLFTQINIDIPLYIISPDQIQKEKERFEKAIISTREEILLIRNKVSKSLGEDEALIFDAHLMVLEDNALITETVQHIERNKQNVEYGFNLVVERYINFFKTIEDEYLRERISDIKDVSRRVLNNLIGTDNNNIQSYKQNRIIVSEDITPSQAVGFDKNQLLGFITDSGGATSHFVIMSRSFKIPAVVGLHNATEKISQSDYLLIDGYEGLVYINPTKGTIKEYDRLANKQLEIERTFHEELVEKTETLDGHSIELMANIEASDHISESIQNSFDGIGLFRTESIYLKKNNMPSEEEQFKEYASVIKNTKDKPVIIRTLDIGGDKLINGVHDDSFLGLRAIRFCLENLTIFKTQLRAILRASVFGDIRIMYPMISGIEELDKANYILNEVKEELLSENIDFNKKILVGAMIELPSAVSIIDLLAKKVDFFSVGTNDLIQYLLAVDRMDDRVSHLYQPTHPAVLRSLLTIFEQSNRNQRHVSVCGEMAGEPIYAALLIGLGAKSLSVSVSRLPEIKHYIRLMNLGELKKLTNHLMTLDQAELIEQKLYTFLENLKS